MGLGAAIEAAATNAPQVVIENKMREILRAGHYEAAHLFSNEGLPLAMAHNLPENAARPSTEHNQIAELAILFHNVRHMAAAMTSLTKLREISIEGATRRKFVFRFFEAFGQEVILAVVVPPNTAYRKVTNELEKLILSQPF